ncbi:MAG: SDR family oxidoreductase [Gammaproteobacteria bacterium]|nr:SDR family oxidoreductase [Gammaproteobacteria bacterium]
MGRRHYVVTGASSGIGLAIVHRMLAEGADVTAVSRRPAVVPESVLAENSDRLRTAVCDLCDFRELDRCMKALTSGNAILDGVVLCHGYGDFGSLEEFSAERIERLVDTNLVSHMLIVRHVIPILKRLGRGDLVFMGSETGIRGRKMGAVYSATKFAINGFAESLRAECAAGTLRDSGINPGMVYTPFFDDLDFRPADCRDNFIEPEDVARIVSTILGMPHGTVIDKVNLTPQKRVVRKKEDDAERTGSGN